MSLHVDLLRQARQLAVKEPRRPLQASLRRAISASYYALFHLLVDEATKRMLRGHDRAALRRCLARAFGHAAMRQVAQQFSDDNVSRKLAPGLNGQTLQPELVRVASALVEIQEARHQADYDLARRFTRREALDLVGQAELAFVDWNGVRGSIQADTFLTGLLAFGNMRG
ncbi:MAG: hypothetical protein OXK73_06970 [Rhodospirillaceae bacterium]|nr:hypothetical protein [Rhodospirillaceae bacterium]